MRTVGIIGGLGPGTTAEFYLEINSLYLAVDKTKRPKILICNVPLDTSVEKDVLQSNINQEQCLPFLINAARQLEKGGADFIVMPCNTLHIFINEIRKSVSIPVLSIIGETTKFLLENLIEDVGIVATTTTVTSRMYERALERNGIKMARPNQFDQDRLGKMIHRLVQGRCTQRDRRDLIEIIEKFKKDGIKNVLLACTDLQLLSPQVESLAIHDTMKILAAATVRELLKDLGEDNKKRALKVRSAE